MRKMVLFIMLLASVFFSRFPVMTTETVSPNSTLYDNGLEWYGSEYDPYANKLKTDYAEYVYSVLINGEDSTDVTVVLRMMLLIP